MHVWTLEHSQDFLESFRTPNHVIHDGPACQILVLSTTKFNWKIFWDMYVHCVGWCLGSGAWAKQASFLYSGASCSYGRKRWNAISHCVVPPYIHKAFHKTECSPLRLLCHRRGLCTSAYMQGRATWPRVYLNLRKTLKYRNLRACERLSFYRNMGT
jgi:hypothetical protein